jgi:hypothetical protein
MSKTLNKKKIIDIINNNLTLSQVIDYVVVKARSKQTLKIRRIYNLFIQPEEQVSLFEINSEIESFFPSKFKIIII